ncbi:hypothetical protein DPMN_026716 [Dreissena polymorpha]|uniref:Uncharacterized protein n=1 Tax=Dreissena polymorpha TaxID=45954 RepID=A0A9D4LS79_DREPO|nr:hypothetical protein DPMN_026716 [Dreissena polymorpha]
MGILHDTTTPAAPIVADPWSSGNTLASQSRDGWFDAPLHLTYLLVFRMRR